MYAQSKELNKLTMKIVQIFTDDRDGNKYKIISTEDRYWLNQKEEYKPTAFVNDHEEKNSIKNKRMLGVRCVIPIIEFNKLSIE